MALLAKKTSPLKPQTDAAVLSFIEDHECLNAMPENSVRILQLLADPNFQMPHLIRLIKQDAAIAARIIKVVNSAAYARTHRITQLDRATVYLGVSTVKEIVAATTVAALCKPGNVGKYTTRDLWDHSVGVAVLSREFAQRSGTFDPELAFLAGILHDVGLLLSAQSEPDSSESVFADAEELQIPFLEVEKGYFGFDHTELGAALAAAWKFPDEVAAVIKWHHAPRKAPERFKAICAIVYLADTLCAKAEVGFPLTVASQFADEETHGNAGLTRAETDDVLEHFKVLLRLHLS